MHAVLSQSTHSLEGCGEPDPSGLAPAALAPIDPLAPLDATSERAGAALRIRAGLVRRGGAMRHFASDVGQGTVEYVGLLLLMATLLAAIVGGAKTMGGDKKIGQKVVDQIGASIDKVDSKK